MAGPELIWLPSNSIPRNGGIQVKGMTKNYTVHFGDGATRAGRPNQIHNYTWTSAGPYTAVIVPTLGGTALAKVSFRVLDEPHPNITIDAAPDVDHTARVTFTDPDTGPVGRFELRWEKGGDAEQVIGIPGSSVDHYYGAAGTYEIQVSDLWSGFKQTESVALTDPVYDPDATLTEDTADPTRYTAKLTVTHVSGTGRKLTVDWGDGSIVEIDAVVGTTTSHQYAFSDDYLVRVYYSDDIDGQHRYLPVTMPYGSEAPA
jgi:hypothetical protein